MNRNETVLNYTSFAKSIAGKICTNRNINDSWTRNDCESAAVESLIRAIDNYDESMGATIGTFAGIKIRGGVLDHLRMVSGTPRNCTDKAALLKVNFSNPENFNSFENSLAYSVNGTEGKVCNKDLVQKIFAHINTLKCREDTIEILKLYFWDGYTLREIGDMKGISYTRVSQIILSVSRKVRKAFKKCWKQSQTCQN